MCRFVIYQGLPVLLSDILLDTENSLIQQSKHAKKRRKPVNGDGFGIGWYPLSDDPEPGVFVGLEPAWASRNLQQLCRKVSSSLFFAHIRDATEGMPISQSNCHPFYNNQLLWMHNGKINGFEKVKRNIIDQISDESLNNIQGNTDSEHLFALFQTFLNEQTNPDLAGLTAALQQTTTTIRDMVASHDKPSYLNLAVSNSEGCIATRYSSKRDVQPASLYYTQGLVLLNDEDDFRIKPKTGNQDAIIVASEPLTRFKQDWLKVERNQMLVVTPDNIVSIHDIA